jgi:hypothetical protein
MLAPLFLKVLVEHVQGDVRQQWGQDAALRRAGVGVPVLAEFGQNPGLEERLDQPEHPLVLDPAAHPVHQGRVADGVKARLDIRFQNPPVTQGAEVVDLGQSVCARRLGLNP